MDMFTKIPQNVHQQKMGDILQVAETVAKKFVDHQWPNLWLKLQDDLNQNQNELFRVKKHYERIDIHPNPLDLTNLCHLLRSARHSPVSYIGTSKEQGKLLVYSKVTWDEPIEDVKMKLEFLQKILRKDSNSSNSNNLQQTEDFKNILALSINNDGPKHITSYVHLLNTNQLQEALLNAHLNENGTEDVLSALKLAFPMLDCTEYSFVLYLAMLKDRRNHLIHHRVEEITLALHKNDFNIINRCIKNIFCLMKNNLDTDFDEFQDSIEKKIEQILSGPNDENNSTGSVKSKHKCEDCKMTFTGPIDFEAHMKGDKHRKMIDKKKSDESSSPGPSVIPKNSSAYHSNQTPLSLQNVKNDKPKAVVQSTNASISDNPKLLKSTGSIDNWECSICKVTMQSCQKDDHLKGEKHRKNVEKNKDGVIAQGVQNVQRSQSAVEKMQNMQNAGAVQDSPKENKASPEQLQRKVVDNLLNSFLESFDPFPRACALLKGLRVFTAVDIENIRAPPSREEKVVEFIRIIQLKRNWYDSLINVLIQVGHDDLVEQLKKEFDSLNI